MRDNMHDSADAPAQARCSHAAAGVPGLHGLGQLRGPGPAGCARPARAQGELCAAAVSAAGLATALAENYGNHDRAAHVRARLLLVKVIWALTKFFRLFFLASHAHNMSPVPNTCPRRHDRAGSAGCPQHVRPHEDALEGGARSRCVVASAADQAAGCSSGPGRGRSGSSWLAGPRRHGRRP